MPSLTASRVTHQTNNEELEQPKSILRKCTDFTSLPPTVKKKSEKLGKSTNFAFSTSTKYRSNQTPNTPDNTRRSRGLSAGFRVPAPKHVDSSFDSEQELDNVREKYKKTKLDSERAE